MKKIAVFLLLALLISATGCTMQAPAQKTGQQQEGQSKKQVTADPVLAEKVKQVAKSVKGVEDCTAVVINDEISVAVKVSGFDRLRLKSIRKEVHSKVRETGEGFKVNVTTDKKLFAGLREIEKQISSGRVQSMAEVQKRVEKINKDMRG